MSPTLGRVMESITRAAKTVVKTPEKQIVAVIGPNGVIGRAAAESFASSSSIITYGVTGKNAATNPIAGVRYCKSAIELSTFVGGDEYARGKKIVLFPAIKPKDFATVLPAYGAVLTDQVSLIVSPAAGLTANEIRACYSNNGKFHAPDVVRAMPISAIAIRQSVTGMTADPSVSQDNIELAQKLCERFGSTMWFKTEEEIDMFTAAGGCLPGFQFSVAESMVKAAEEIGFSRDQALEFTARILKASTELMVASGKDPQVLADEVTSRGGATRAGRDAIEGEDGKKMDEIMKEAYERAYARTKELSKLTPAVNIKPKTPNSVALNADNAVVTTSRK